MEPLDNLVAGLLALFYQLIPSYGLSIILLTLSVMIVLTPLTLKGTKSMMAMQRLQPEMKKIQNQYRDDREKLNEELLKFYKENDINPVGGCLPLVVQLPVFLVLFSVLRGLTRRASGLGITTGWVQGQLGLGAKPTKPPSELLEQVFDPAFVNPSTSLYKALHGSTEMNFMGIDLATSASQALKESVATALPYLVLIAMVAFTGWYQQRQIQGRNANSAQSPQQQMIMKIMPIMLPVISFTLPGGLVLYFFVSNLYRVGQQAWITRTLYSDRDETPVKADDKGPDKAAGASGASKEVAPSNGSSSGGGWRKWLGMPDDTAAESATETSSSARASEKKGRATPKRDGSTAKPGRVGSGKSTKSAKSAKSKSSNSRKQKTYTSDPKAKKGVGSPEVAPRGRKKGRKA